jgi:hypothetical protein
LGNTKKVLKPGKKWGNKIKFDCLVIEIKEDRQTCCN